MPIVPAEVDILAVPLATQTISSGRTSMSFDLMTCTEAPAIRATSKLSSPRSTNIEPVTSKTHEFG
jgi:hypothetical protein